MACVTGGFVLLLSSPLIAVMMIILEYQDTRFYTVIIVIINLAVTVVNLATSCVHCYLLVDHFVGDLLVISTDL